MSCRGADSRAAGCRTSTTSAAGSTSTCSARTSRSTTGERRRRADGVRVDAGEAGPRAVMIRILGRILIALVVLVALAAAGGVWFLRRSLPPARETVKAAGLEGPVTIVYDSLG